MTTIASGPPGVEVPHIITPTWEAATFTMNDLAASPRVRLKRITGYRSLPETDDERVENTGRSGETPLPSYARGKTIVYEGSIEAKTLDALRAKSEALKRAIRVRAFEQSFRANGVIPWDFTARVMQYDEDDEQLVGLQARWPFQRDFSLGLRMSDARFYVAAGEDTGAIALGAAIVNNAGMTDTDPLISATITGGDFTVTTAEAFGWTLKLVGLPAGALTVDFRRRTAKVGAADVKGKIDVVNSPWWFVPNAPGLIPGDNHLTAAGAASDWRVQWRHASE